MLSGIFVKPGKSGVLPAHKPGFTVWKSAGLPGFSGAQVPGLHSLWKTQ